MKTKITMMVALCAGLLGLASLAIAQHHEEHGGGGNMERVDRGRAEAPKFVAHAPGAHPRGRTVPAHQIRVLAPRVVKYGNHGTWKHWGHPNFARPNYYWNWGGIQQVTCVAEDSYGDQYPVTEATFPGFGLANMTAVEDDALDRAYQESGGDPNCYLATCSHF